MLEAVAKFAESMRRMRAHLDHAENLRYALQRHSWFVDAVEIYCAAVRSLATELADRDVQLTGLQPLREYLAGYVASEPLRLADRRHKRGHAGASEQSGTRVRIRAADESR